MFMPQTPCTGELVVAFESELGLWHRKGGWENEFEKLCRIQARLRVLYCTFEVGEGRRYPGLLRERLRQTQPGFDHNQGEFLLIAGPAYNSDDPLQPWLAYSIAAGLELTPLSLDDPLLAVKFLYPSDGTPEIDLARLVSAAFAARFDWPVASLRISPSTSPHFRYRDCSDDHPS